VSDTGSPNRAKRQIGWIVAALIVLAFAGVIVAKQGSKATAEAPSNPATPTVTQPSVAVTDGPSSSRADAVAAYEAALRSGKPIYLLFHSLTCVPCVEISAVVDKVIPTYDGKVVFVNAISDDEPSQQLAAKFKFQYIPQSFFIDAKGNVVDSFTGAMEEPAMRAYLDRLTAQ